MSATHRLSELEIRSSWAAHLLEGVMYVVTRNPNGTPGPVVELCYDVAGVLHVNGKRVWGVRVYGTITALETGMESLFIMTDDYLAWEQMTMTENPSDRRRW